MHPVTDGSIPGARRRGLANAAAARWSAFRALIVIRGVCCDAQYGPDRYDALC
jgi:hypothetical protein